MKSFAQAYLRKINFATLRCKMVMATDYFSSIEQLKMDLETIAFEVIENSDEKSDEE